jgi:hypothetical protein
MYEWLSQFCVLSVTKYTAAQLWGVDRDKNTIGSGQKCDWIGQCLINAGWKPLGVKQFNWALNNSIGL